MRTLSAVRNPHAVSRLARNIAPARWSPLAPPVDPLETQQRMRAQSLLAGLRYRDGSTNPDTLTLDQAQDVLRWAGMRNC